MKDGLTKSKIDDKDLHIDLDFTPTNVQNMKKLGEEKNTTPKPSPTKIQNLDIKTENNKVESERIVSKRSDEFNKKRSNSTIGNEKNESHNNNEELITEDNTQASK